MNDEVVIKLAGCNTVTSILTSESVRRFGLEKGMGISASIKAFSVLLQKTCHEIQEIGRVF